MRIQTWLTFLLFFLLVPTIALAQTIRIRVFAVDGPYKLSPEDVSYVMDIAAKKLESAGFKVVYELLELDVQLYQPPFPFFSDLEESMNDYLKRKTFWGPRRSETLNYFIFPPLVYNSVGDRELGGKAQGICYIYSETGFIDTTAAFGYSANLGGAGNSNPRLYMSGILMAHELGHLLGAVHEMGPENPYVMNQFLNVAYNNLAKDPNYEVEFSEFSKSQMKLCVDLRFRKYLRKIPSDVCFKDKGQTLTQFRTCVARLRKTLKKRFDS